MSISMRLMEVRGPQASERRVKKTMEVFLCLAQLFPDYYEWLGSDYATGVALNNWVLGFMDDGIFHSSGFIDEASLNRGVDACRKLGRSYPPSLGEFRNLCKG